MCDELGVPRIDSIIPFHRSCNDETGNCVSFVGLANTNGGWIDVPAEHAILHEIIDFDFDATIIF